jgi:hypothetical protein
MPKKANRIAKSRCRSLNRSLKGRFLVEPGRPSWYDRLPGRSATRALAPVVLADALCLGPLID